MSTSAMTLGSARTLRFWSTTNGKKAVMAVTGVVLAGFIAVHLAGNLQIFLGPERFNAYAASLRELPALVWTVRAALLIAVFLHIWSTIQLAVRKKDARPVKYARHESFASTYASRTMYMSGPIIAAFVIYHLMQFTFGVGGTYYDPADAYGNVIAGFRNPVVSVFYILAMALLCLHLRHGLWSMFQTLGFHHQRYTPRLRVLAALAAIVVFLGFVSIPVAVLAGFVPQIF